MNEIKCPKCGTMFQIDEKDYDSIVKQIRDGEFNAEIKRREEELRKYTKSEIDSLKERLDFEKKTNVAFIVQKIRSSSTYVPLVDINDYLRFEVLQKDYDEGGNQYNNWSLRGVRDGMPPVTRHIPDFNTEWKPYNSEENRERIYRKWLNERGDQ